MPMSSKFAAESTGEKIVKIGRHLAKIWTKYDSLLFFGTPCTVNYQRIRTSENFQRRPHNASTTHSH